MKKLISIFTLLVASTLLFAAPKKIIFDTDMGNDIDDALALLILFEQIDKRTADLELIAINKDNPMAAIFVNIVADHYGHENVPIAVVTDGATKKEGSFTGAVARMLGENGMYKYPRRVDASSKMPDATKEIRKVLANAKDSEVIYISVGFSTNMARALKSKPDEISKLSGEELFAKKVKCVSIMAGKFSKATLANPEKFTPEYNAREDVKSFAEFLKLCKAPIVFSGFEVGEHIKFPHSEVDKLGGNNPVFDAYNSFTRGNRHDRPCWDLTSVMWVFNPSLFEISPKGIASVDETGRTSFKESNEGKHQYLILGKASHNLTRKLVESVLKARVAPRN